MRTTITIVFRLVLTVFLFFAVLSFFSWLFSADAPRLYGLTNYLFVSFLVMFLLNLIFGEKL